MGSCDSVVGGESGRTSSTSVAGGPSTVAEASYKKRSLATACGTDALSTDGLSGQRALACEIERHEKQRRAKMI